MIRKIKKNLYTHIKGKKEIDDIVCYRIDRYVLFLLLTELTHCLNMYE